MCRVILCEGADFNETQSIKDLIHGKDLIQGKNLIKGEDFILDWT